MNPRKFCAAVFALALTSMMAVAQTASGPNEGSALSRDPATGAYNFSWWGQAGRTYFLQQSEDLMNWNYVPVIEPGAGQSIGWGFTSTAPKFFLRLKYTDISTTDPFNDDFDGDGVSNWDELMQGTDPFSAVMDTNGLPIDWEIHYFGHTGVNPNDDPDGDGLTNIQEFQLGTDPTDPLNSNANFARDSDHNGIADWWEILNFGHIGNDPNQVVAGKGGLTLKQVFDNGLDLVASSSVGDGIPDAWKIQHYLDPLNPNVANEDPDGDGLTNADEYAAGTDPMNWDTDGDYIPDGQDMAPLVANPVDPDNVRIDVPSWDTLSQQPNFDPSQVDYTSIQVQWDVADWGGTATGYRIEKRVDSNPWKELATVGAGTTSQADQGLIASRQYQYRVIAIVDSGNTHVESSGAITYYQAALGLRLAVKPSSWTNYKSNYGIYEFTTQNLPPDNPPKYYLVDTLTSSLDGGDGGSGTNSSWSSTTIGKTKYTITNTPAQHLRTYVGTYGNDYSYTGSDSSGSSSSSTHDHSGYNWSDQKRGKGRTSSDTHGDGHDDYSSSSSGPNYSSGSSSGWTGTYQLTGTYQPTDGPPLWIGYDFDPNKGSLSYSGTSTSSSYGNGSDGSTSGSQGSSTPNSSGVWSGSITYSSTHSDGTAYPSSTSPLYGPAWSGGSYYYYYGYWFNNLTSTTSTQRTYKNYYTSGNYHSNTDGTEVLSQEYDTATFKTDTINDLPDYPTDWNNNYYGWGYYDWGYWGWDGYSYWGGWYPYGYPWYGWWVAGQHLSTDESSLSISKMKYKFTANPSAPTTIKWYEVFVPDDDLTTPDVDESKNIKIIAERTWTLGAGQNECPEYEIDPTTRNDGNGYYTLMIEPAHLSTPLIGEAGKDVTGSDTDPGKVILINDGDSDNDAVPDYADGYQLDPGVDAETHCYTNSFTPVYVSWATLDPQKGKIKFTYDASDPKAITANGIDAFALPTNGKLRIWTKDGWEDRNGADAKQGGDYIKPGVEYTLQDLGLDPDYYWYGGMTFYIEGVKLSDAVADLPIKVEVDPTGSLGYCWSDQLRFTVSKISFTAFNYQDTVPTQTDHLVPSGGYSLKEWYQDYQQTPDSYLHYSAFIQDPRAQLGNIRINGTRMPLTKTGTAFTSPDFICVPPGTKPDDGYTGVVIPVAPGTASVEYNAEKDVPVNPRIKRMPADFDELAKHIREAEEAVTETDPTARGIAIADMAAAQVKNDKRWVYSVRVTNDANRTIVSIGGNPVLTPTTTPSITDTTEMDFVRLKKPQNLKVGQNLNVANIERIHEVKNTVTGRLSADQRTRLLAIVDGDESKLIVTWGKYESTVEGGIVVAKSFTINSYIFKTINASMLSGLAVFQMYSLYKETARIQDAAIAWQQSGGQDLRGMAARTELFSAAGDFADAASAEPFSAGLIKLQLEKSFLNDLNTIIGGQ